MLNAFFDDSGTHRGSDVVVVGGLIGTPEQWAKFGALWSAKLLAPLPGKPPLRKFHLSTCNAGVDEFAGYSRTERDALMHDFREIITDCELIGTSSAIEVGAWDELITGPMRLHYGSALEMCVQSCADEAIKIAGKHPAGDRITLSFDRGIQPRRQRRSLGANPFNTRARVASGAPRGSLVAIPASAPRRPAERRRGAHADDAASLRSMAWRTKRD